MSGFLGNVRTDHIARRISLAFILCSFRQFWIAVGLVCSFCEAMSGLLSVALSLEHKPGMNNRSIIVSETTEYTLLIKDCLK
jgi:hypothetical protein